MATTTDLLLDAFGRISETVHDVLDGIDPGLLGYRADPSANTIAWLVWHLARVQDDHVADVAGMDQAWTDDGWAERFGLPFPVHATGYGHSPQDVAALSTVSAELLVGYFDAVHERTTAYVRSLSDADLDRVVDTRWNPPVTLAVRLVSVLSDDLQHAGQASYVCGLATRAR